MVFEKRYAARLALGSTLALAGCGIDIGSLQSRLSPASPESPHYAPLETISPMQRDAALWSQACDATPRRAAEHIQAILHNAVTVPGMFPGPLANHSVLRALSRTIASAAVGGLKAGLELSGNAPTMPDAPAPSTIGVREFRDFIRLMARHSLDPAPHETNTVWKTMVEYLMAFYDGKFVDRMGNTIAKPDFGTLGGTSSASRIDITISDQDVAGAAAVLVELLADAIVPTPVWGDAGAGASCAAAKPTHYPGGTTDEPTALALGVVPHCTPLAADGSATGITKTKAQLMRYLARTAASEASTIGGIGAGGFAGFGASFGVFAKISIGDNLTVQTVIRAALAHVFARAAEQGSCEILTRIPDPTGTGKTDYDKAFALLQEILAHRRLTSGS